NGRAGIGVTTALQALRKLQRKHAGYAAPVEVPTSILVAGPPSHGAVRLQNAGFSDAPGLVLKVRTDVT
ncbi:MAG TPA: hypothetical protein PKA58_30555, partial [Polyangium sp.]|nr:hypothetical protein [Polyangium sp.]